MKLTIRWKRVVAFGLGVCLTVSAVPVFAVEHIIVLVSGEKAPDGGVPTNPTRPQLVREGASTEAVASNEKPASPPAANTTGQSGQSTATATTVVTEVKTVTPKRPLTDLDRLVDEAVAATSRRYLTAEQHTPWQIFHGLVALRQNFILKVNNEKTSALKWVQSGPFFRGEPLIEQTPYGGRFHPFTVPFHFEGHPNQFLAILSMAELPRNYTFKAGNGASISVDDMLRNAQADCNDAEEVTWTLWAFARYMHPSSQWTNKYGQHWSMERLVQTEVGKEVKNGACGGCHGLFALALARNAYVQSGYQLQGAFLSADMKVKRYIAETRAFQNSDGSFSADHYRSPMYAGDFNKRITASGHILEWLMIGVSNEELEQEWLKRGVHSIARDLVDHRAAPAECGPLYHALHSLVLYRQRTRPELSDPTLVESSAPAPVNTPSAPVLTNPAKPDGSAAPKTHEFTPPMRVEPVSPKEPSKLVPNSESAKPAGTSSAVKVPSPLPSDPNPELPKESVPTPAAPPMPEPMITGEPTSKPNNQQPEKTPESTTNKKDGEFQVPLPPTDD